MAKQPVTTERFRIHFETPSEAVGHIIAILTRAGMQGIGYELITEEHVWAAKKSYAETGPILILRALADGKPHKRYDIGRAFGADGRNPGNCSNAIARVMRDKLVKRVSDGTYQLTAAGMKKAKALGPPPADAPEPAEAKRKQRRDRGAPRKSHAEPGRHVLMRMLLDGKPHQLDEMHKLFEQQDRHKKSVSPNLDTLMKRKAIRRVSAGIYQMIDSAVAKAAFASALNGSGGAAHA